MGTVAERFQDGGQVHAGRGGGGSSASRRPLGTLGAPYISRRVYKTFFFFGSEGGSQASRDLWDLEDTGRKKGLVTG